MTTFQDLKDYFREENINVIIAGDGQPRTHKRRRGEIETASPAGGVSVALDSIALAANATYIARGKTPEDKEVVDRNNKIRIESSNGGYTLKRLFLSEEDVDNYYFGFSNQTLWPLCHVAFERPIFNTEWYEGYKRVNKAYAQAIREEIKGKTFVWIQDYQLALVPTYLGELKDVTVGFFWHIPWPTWEMYRILPWKKDILWSLLSCDYLAFHRRYQMRNFIECVTSELEARTVDETRSIYFDRNRLVTQDMPLGIDTDVITSLATPGQKDTYLTDIIRKALGVGTEKTAEKNDPLDEYFDKYQVIFGVDRLDYTKGIPNRLQAIDAFLTKYPQYIGKVIYLGIMSPSREKIPSYQSLKKEVKKLEDAINKKHQRGDWKPLHLIYEFYSREDVITFYRKAKLCMVTPLDDGMNLVSKEFIIAAGTSEDPGMLILSQFAGSAIDLSSALIVNPYDISEMTKALKKGLEMSRKERVDRTHDMVNKLEEHNIYEWARSFTKNALNVGKDNRREG